MDTHREVKKLELNVAYGNSLSVREENVYDTPDSVPKNDKAIKLSKPKKEQIVAIIAGFTLVLAVLALIVAGIVIYFSTHGKELDNSLIQSNLQSILTLQQKVKTLQVELNKSMYSLQNRLNVYNDTISNQDATISALTSTLARSLGNSWNPVRSCDDIPPLNPSGDYWIQTNGTSNPIQVYCDMNRTSCSCANLTGGWMRVANLDMTDPNQHCPAGFRQVNRTSPPLHMHAGDMD